MEDSLSFCRDKSVLKIAGPLDIAGSEAFRQHLLDLVQEDAPLTIDLADVDSCDASALQLLCSAGKSAERLGKSLVLRRIPEAVTNTAAAIGFAIDEQFDRPAEETEVPQAVRKAESRVR